MITNTNQSDSINLIIACVCEYSGLDHHGVAQLFMKTRVRHVSELRKLSAYLIRRHTYNTLTDIAKVFNRTDHTTCIHWIKWAESEINRCNHFKKSVRAIESMPRLVEVDCDRIRIVRERVLDMGEDND